MSAVPIDGRLINNDRNWHISPSVIVLAGRIARLPRPPAQPSVRPEDPLLCPLLRFLPRLAAACSFSHTKASHLALASPALPSGFEHT